MALQSTVYDFEIALSHVDRALEEKLAFKAARHPSETMERLWLRALAYCWLYEERLAFGPGLGEPEAPDLEARDYTGRVTLWARVGRPDVERVLKTLSANPGARSVLVFESPARLDAFLAEARESGAARLQRLELVAVDPALLGELASADVRRSKLTLTVVGDHLYAERAGVAADGPLTRGSL